jgi:hypothetical protein
MIHDEMTHYFEKIRPNYHPDSMEASLIDWIYLGRFVGYRAIEWCQKLQKEYLQITHSNWKGPTSYAFIAEDFQFFKGNKQPIYDLTNISLDDIVYVTIRFRKQKNDQNGETVPYYRDFANPAFCPVHAALRIYQRAQRLEVPEEEPMGVYFCQKGKYKNQRCFITANQVATFLQSAARIVFKLKPNDKSIQRWTSHSIRVTACNLLHRQGFSDTYIQTRLRWRSNAFLAYLRNTLYTAAAHTKALHIPDNNLPRLTNEYTTITLSSGDIAITNSPSGRPLQRHREHEELEQVLHAGAA